LGPAFPEVIRNHGSVLHILDYEEENARRLAEKSARYAAKLAADFPRESRSIEPHEAVSFYEALKCLQQESDAAAQLVTRLAYKLYESHGLLSADIERLAAISGRTFDVAAFAAHSEERRRESKAATALEYELSRAGGLKLDNLPETRDEFKYLFTQTESGTFSFQQKEN